MGEEKLFPSTELDLGFMVSFSEYLWARRQTAEDKAVSRRASEAGEATTKSEEGRAKEERQERREERNRVEEGVRD
jgi:hypothetical protein